ncbi:hypothetical protein ACGFSG_25595 [Streptomyces sp. NPDC048512]|uniref:hypothetical protein n=1 Tax=unclassified Streptomyces TaxID=2593676 RepID=UPI0009C0B13F|nr:hypothetical protein [Streptomyces sp. M41(2017)]OQQ13840.1 hypothetical protein B0675_26810 [Streptomyces sp. M41(2017)]
MSQDITPARASTDEWLYEITAEARKSGARVFSVSVPLNHATTPGLVSEPLLAAAIEGVEAQGWQLESVTSYGGALPTYTTPPHENTAQFWALLVFRTTYKGIV